MRIELPELHIFCELQESALVKRLRDENYSLRQKVADLETKLNRAEYELGCEVHVNGELLDLLHAHRIQYRNSLKKR